MKRALSIVVACSLVAGAQGELRQQPPPRGIVVEVVEKGSAADLAGIKPGDELISWTRSAASSIVATVNEFRTPFDARAFELEQLPHGGTAVAVWRNGGPVVVKLIPGSWGVTVRPFLNVDDLAIYNTGRAAEKDRPADTLSTWRPVIDRFVAAGEIGNATWLLARAGSAFATLDQIDQANAVFAEAVDLCQRSSNPPLEAMVWEAKGRAYHPEATPAGASPLKKPRLEAALMAHSRALVLRQQLGGVPAAAESQLLSGYVITWSVQDRKIPDGTPEEKETFKRSGVWMQDALATIAKEVPGSFAHARALVRASFYFGVSGSPRPTSVLTTEEMTATRALRFPYLREARPILERVAPTNDLLRVVLQALYAPVSLRSDKESSAEAEDLARALIRFAEQNADRALFESSARNLAAVLSRRGDVEGALAVVDGLVKTGTTPVSLANFVVDMASEAHNQGAVDEAISILERQAKLLGLPPAVEVRIAYGLSNYYRERGDYSAAERTLLPLVLRLEDASVNYGQRRDLLFTLANLAADRGDSALAETYAFKALKAADDGPTIAGVKQSFLEFLSTLAARRGDTQAARQFIRQSIALGEAEKSPNEWNQLLLRIELAQLGGDRASVSALTAQKLALARKQQPGGRKEADSLYDAGLVSLQQGQEAAALPYFREALPMIRRLEPRSISLAKTLTLLGRAEGTTGGWDAGISHVEEAMDLLDDHRLRGAEDGARALMRGEFSDVYAQAVDLLVEGKQYERAFNVVERSRARLLLDMLASRDLPHAGSTPPALRQEQNRLEAQYDAEQAALADMSMSDGAAMTAAQVELDALRLQLNDVDRRISAIDPKASARLHPAPLTLPQAQSRLDPGTALLSYLVTSRSTYLFVVTPASTSASKDAALSVYTLPAGESELRESIRTFANLIEFDRDPKTANRPALVARGRELYDWLVRPAEAELANAKRVLLSLDGPLLPLEFSALVRNTAGPPIYFVEWKPIYRAPSMAVYAQILESRRQATGRRTLVAFADPIHSASTASLAEDDLDSLVRSGTALTPLPGARREAEAISGLFAPNAVTFMGAAATESRAKAIGRTTRLIHFAVHGFFNDNRPLDSGLVLALSAKPGATDGNGLLQAWEVFEHVRLDADLVTLSACETGFTGATTGDGLVGLTSAFIYAGARSVVASQRKVADGPTAELMTFFYRNLRNGQTKDEALRNAQVALIRMARPQGSSTDYSSPAHWAAFTLTGDWK